MAPPTGQQFGAPKTKGLETGSLDISLHHLCATSGDLVAWLSLLSGDVLLTHISDIAIA